MRRGGEAACRRADVKAINGGPMNGAARGGPEAPRVRGCSASTSSGGADAVRREASACIKSPLTVAVCPMGLSPTCSRSPLCAAEWDIAEANDITSASSRLLSGGRRPGYLPLLDWIPQSAKQTGHGRIRCALRRPNGLRNSSADSRGGRCAPVGRHGSIDFSVADVAAT